MCVCVCVCVCMSGLAVCLKGDVLSDGGGGSFRVGDRLEVCNYELTLKNTSSN